MLEINQKNDILIPFETIGSKGWQHNTLQILAAYADNNNDDLPDIVAESDLASLEKRLNTTIPKGLKLFYQTFGLADIGEQLQAFDDIDYLQNIWAENPEYAPDFTDEDRKILPDLISFSDYLGNGNMFCFHQHSHEIYYFDHDTSPLISKMFDRVDDYIKGCLIFAQGELFGNAKPEQVEQWCEDIVIDLLGSQTVKKWRY